MSVTPGGVKEVVPDIESNIQVTRAEGKFRFGEGAAGVRQRVMEVEVT